ncbi:formate dehydrogenase accessory protein FdhE [Microvirga mediterraneensis]|uniref:Protein FdhE homolog n=1 Tax=Microvirga mediterraneensis TaxID=2754695 RepID=A0A838BTY4_9HYPH|nr:formate dehydrogenase accessory protein FdhE [Microvirga mediterraneensis]MBA1158818.1 formate dehydrogenase accessory protein FdhE [Microvirga mediterraneensis]
MTHPGSVDPNPASIGRVPAPPFVKLPDPRRLFEARSERLEFLAQANELAPYLRFIAGIAAAQSAIQDNLPEPQLPFTDALDRARKFAMPPLDRNRVDMDDVVCTTLGRLFDAVVSLAKPNEAQAALARVKAAPAEEMRVMMRSVLTDSIPADAIAEHVYVAAGLQVHFARLAARLDKDKLTRITDGVCPCCGGAPTSSLVVGWMEAEGTRYCSCSLCGTLWNVVRVKCVLCSSGKGIGYQEIEGGAGTIKAECCDTCRSYVKILYQQKDMTLDPVADDIASLGLDILLKDGEYRRGSFNPFLLGI